MKLAFIIVSTVLFAACNSAPPVQQNANARADRPGASPESVIAHASKDEKWGTTNANTYERGKWSQSGEPIDTKEFDTAVMAAERTVESKPADVMAKQLLAAAYFKRGFALTEARQYASALGDYRRAVKQDPSNADAKQWIDKIVLIYSGMKKEYPREGEEPPPLPFSKGK